MRKIIFYLLSMIALVSLMACTQPAQASELKSAKPRLTPAVNPADMTTLVNGNSAFAFNLYQTLKNTDGNLFYSPYSISEALAMTFGGARGETEKQMAAALQFKLNQSQLHPAFNSLEIELAKRGQGAKGTDSQGFRLKVVNAIWGQQGFKFSAEYLDLLAQNYGAGLRILDFIKSPDPARLTINQWASEQTEGKIQNLLPPGSITDLTRLVLTNAIYFNAAWQYQFDKSATIDGKFTLLDGSQIAARMMKQMKSFGYAEGSNYQAVELPYDGNELSLVVLLPKADQFKAFEAAMSNPQVSDILKSIKYQQVALSMPKFKMESQFGLKKTLSDLGMPVAFTEAADFSGMDGAKDLHISDVIHKAFIAVDEAGTEAAAVTAVIVGTTAMPLEPKQVTIDHPFIFFIRDIKTGAILFMGRVLNPGT